jgi:hypothetical protein
MSDIDAGPAEHQMRRRSEAGKAKSIAVRMFASRSDRHPIAPAQSNGAASASESSGGMACAKSCGTVTYSA